jgi:hypothetical protein
MKDSPKNSVRTNTPAIFSKKDTWEDLSEIVEITEEETGRTRPAKIRPSLPPVSPAKFRVKGLRLLIVDNDPIRVDALAMGLRNLGARVAVGDFSTHGYVQAARFLPDAIISDLIRPGEEEFLFIQSLRRHPLLRWSSVILSRWWRETAEGEGEVLLDRVLDRIEDSLAPLRIVEERIAARRPLKERIEMIGPAALFRALAAAELSGTLSVNDTWNTFTVDIAERKILSAYRKGIDGEADEDMDAVFQLMLCDSGKWAFSEEKKIKTPNALDTEEALSRINKNLSRLFGRTTKSFEDLERHIFVRPYFLRTASETVSPEAVEIARDIADGANLARFRRFFGRKSDLSNVERIVHTLFRCGAVQFVETPKNASKTDKEIAAARSVVHLLKALIDNPFAPKSMQGTSSAAAAPVVEVGGKSAFEKPAMGTYHVQDVAPERVAATKHRPVRLQPQNSDAPPVALEKNEPPPFSDDVTETDRPGTTDVVVSENPLSVLRAKTTAPPDDVSDAVKQSGSMKLTLESQKIAADDFSPERQTPAQRDKKFMWAAILLAIFLGALLTAGIAFVASQGGRPADNQPQNTPIAP